MERIAPGRWLAVADVPKLGALSGPNVPAPLDS